MKIEIRRAIAADWPSIARLHRRSSIYELDQHRLQPKVRIETVRDSFRGDLWVALNRQSIVGFVACAGNEIMWLYVEPRHFRKGIGRTLLRFAIENCGPVTHMRILSGNRAVHGLCASEGFVEAGGQNIDDIAALIMRRVTLAGEDQANIMAEPIPGGLQQLASTKSIAAASGATHQDLA